MKIDLNNSRINLAAYTDAGEFVHDMTIVEATADMRRAVYAHLDAIADLAAKGTDADRDHAADVWAEIFSAFSDAYKGAGGTKGGKASAQFRNARTAAAEALKNRLAKHYLLVDLKRGKFDITPMTVDQVMAAKGQTGTKARKAARQIHADKGAGKTTGTADAQKPNDKAKQLNLVDQAAKIIKDMDLTQLKIHLKAVEAAVRVEERSKAITGKARQRTKANRASA